MFKGGERDGGMCGGDSNLLENGAKVVVVGEGVVDEWKVGRSAGVHKNKMLEGEMKIG